MKLISAREKGRKGGFRRAELYGEKCRQAMAREGGIATRNRYGNDFFREIRKRRSHYLKVHITRKTKERIRQEALRNEKTAHWAIKAMWLSVAREFLS